MTDDRAQGVRVIRVQNPAQAEPYRTAFAGAYQDIFSQPPYNERFYPSEAAGVLMAYLQVPENITLLAIKGSKVVGFGIGMPLRYKVEVARELTGLLPINQTFYLAELGVLEAWRGGGLGRALVLERLRLVDRQRYSLATLRTSAIRNASYELYIRMGFEDTGVYMEVPARRNDNRTTTDRRLFLSKVLTPDDAPGPSGVELADLDDGF